MISQNDPQKTPFLPILLYVLGFVAILALLAFVFAAVVRHL
jgi:preprotein translocase subunit SecE